MSQDDFAMTAVDHLQQVLHHDIPLTRAMDLQVLSWERQTLQLRLPLAPNVNHKSTMFGGSLYCGAVLVGWGWLYLSLRDAGIADGHIVIQEGQISYPQAVRGEGFAQCSLPDEAAWKRFLTTYQRRGRARITLETQINNVGSEEPAVLFSGQYVLHR
jgi:thioesterase domain-containing protein